MKMPSQVLSLAPSGVPGRRIANTLNPHVGSLGALPKSAGFGALPRSAGFGRLGGRTRAAGCTCQHVVTCPDLAETPGQLGALGAFGAATMTRPNISTAIAAAVRLSATAQKPVAIASAPARGASAVPVIHTVALAPAVAQHFQAAAADIRAGNAPTVSQAINMIRAAIPRAPGWQSSIPAPSRTGRRASANLTNLKGLSGVGVLSPRYGSTLHGGAFGALGFAPSVYGAGATLVSNTSGSSAVKRTAGDIAAGATIGSVVPGIGTAIGAAVGAVLGIVGGLFHHKKAIPKVSQADIDQSQQWLNAYVQVAGSVVGRNFSADMVHDLMMAIAILEPGFWGHQTAAEASVPGVTAFVNIEIPTRMNAFFSAMASVPVGATVTLHDDCSLPGHGGRSCHPEVTYSFANPGVNAPSYVLGPLFAQYFYTMCAIFVTTCAAHLTAPIPQVYTDLLDWFRSSRPGWDTPQPNVITGTDLSVAAPVQTGVNSYAAPTIDAPVVQTQLPSGQQVAVQAPTLQQTQAAFQESPGNVPPVSAPGAPGVAQGIAQLAQSGMLTTTPDTSSAPVDLSSPGTAAANAALAPRAALAGMNWLEIGALALIGIPLVMGITGKPKRHRST